MLPPDDSRGGFGRRAITIAGAALAVLVLGAAAYGGYRYWKTSRLPVVPSDLSDPSLRLPAPEPTGQEASSTQPSDVVAPSPPVGGTGDADSDGLSDNQEILFGTDQHNPDSDGDGYADGEEVSNGYNPLGGGKLGE